MSSPSGFNDTVDCGSDPQLWPNAHVGFSTAGAPCEGGQCGLRAEGAEHYRWTLSASDETPSATSGSIPTGVSPLYLWYDCAPFGGMSVAEFQLESSDPSITFLSFTVQSPFLNGGSLPVLQIATSGCPTGALLVGTLLVYRDGPVNAPPATWSRVKALYR